MLILQIFCGVGIVLLGCIFLQLNQISGAITTLSHQLEFLGAPLDAKDGKLIARRDHSTI
jgi:hypothetical protein